MKVQDFYGKAIRDLRIGRGLTQGELAKKMGTPWFALFMMESGIRKVDTRTLVKAVDALEIPFDDIDARAEWYYIKKENDSTDS